MILRNTMSQNDHNHHNATKNFGIIYVGRVKPESHPERKRVSVGISYLHLSEEIATSCTKTRNDAYTPKVDYSET